MENPVQPVESAPPSAARSAEAGRRAVLMEKAKALEATFLSEMLSYAGMGQTEGPFSGGAGEEQYGSFLREAQAKAIVEHGGIGLAESIFKSLVKHDDANI
jgi:Rod binding domain-containing protein